MADLKLIVKNTTGTAIIISEVGVTVPASGQIVVDRARWHYWGKEDAIVEITTNITSGDLVINDGTFDLSATEALRFLRIPNGVYKTLGSSTIKHPLSIDFIGNVSSTKNETTGEIVYDIGDTGGIGGGLLCNLWQTTFMENSTLKDEWMKNHDQNLLSNITPNIAPWKSRLAAITFSNQRNGADTDIQVYVSRENNGTTLESKLFEWQLRNCRIGRKTNFIADIDIEAGDKISVFASDQGTDPKDVSLVLYWKILEVNEEEVCEDYSGNFSLGGGNGTTTSGTS